MLCCGHLAGCCACGKVEVCIKPRLCGRKGHLLGLLVVLAHSKTQLAIARCPAALTIDNLSIGAQLAPL